MLRKIFIKALTAQTLDNQTGYVYRNRIVPLGTWLKFERQFRQLGCKVIKIFRCLKLRVNIELIDRIVDRVKAVGHAGSMSEQLLHSHGTLDRH